MELIYGHATPDIDKMSKIPTHERIDTVKRRHGNVPRVIQPLAWPEKSKCAATRSGSREYCHSPCAMAARARIRKAA